MATHDRYTEEEVNYIINNYATASWDEILSNIHRDKDSITHKAYKLGIKRSGEKFSLYTQEEDNLIKEAYENTDFGHLHESIVKLISEKMPGRTVGSIQCRAGKLGLCVRKPWTEDEESFLVNHYHDMTVNELANHLENHNRESVYNKIRKLGLTGAYMFAYTDSEKQFIAENYLTLSDQEIADIINRGRYSVKNLRNEMGLHRPLPEGVVYYLSSFIDRNNTEWKKESARNCNYKCVITGDRFDEIHHLYSRNLIIAKVRIDHPGIPTGININEINDELRNNLLVWFRQEQSKHPLGVCLKKEIHREFHDRYGYGNNTPDQFFEFVKDIAPDRLDYIMNL